MIIQMAKRTVYYPVSKYQASELLGSSRRVRSFRAARDPFSRGGLDQVGLGQFGQYPSGRGQLAVFPRCSLDPYDTDMGTSLAP